MKALFVAAVLGVLLPAAGALAQDVIEIDRGEPAPAAPAYDRKDREIGDWARGVIDRAQNPDRARVAARDDDEDGSVCPAPGDRKPHGEVWAEVGTGGYKRTGGIVTQPVGKCGELTVGIDMVDDGNTRRGRRR